MTTIATKDLKNIHEIYEKIKVDYPQFSERFVYFLATCLYLNPDVNLKTALKPRSYGGLIGMDNSSLDTYLKSYKFLQLHAKYMTLHGYLQNKVRKALDIHMFCLVQSQTLILAM